MMIVRRIAGSLLAALLFASPAAQAQVVSPVQGQTASAAEAFAGLDNVEVVRRVERVLDRFKSQPEFVGLSVAVARGDDIVVERGFGIADVEWNLPVDASTVFGIGSITKQFTAASIMKLVEEGKLGLEDPLSQFLPNFETGGRTVTIRQLLNHTSGIPDYATLEYWQKTSRLDLSQGEVLNLIKGVPFHFEPGTSWRYSNTNYRLLGMIIEKLRNRPLGDVLRDEFFTPFGLTHTQAWSDAIIPHRAQGYWFDADAQTLANGDTIGSAAAGGQGGLSSTAGDLIRWQIALTNGRAVSPDAFQQMITSAAKIGQGETEYGFGLLIEQVQGLRRIQHTGGTTGFNGTLTWLPDLGLRIALLSNSFQFPPQPVEEQIIAALTTEVMPPGPRTTEDPRAQAILHSFIARQATGSPEYSTMAPPFADLVRSQLSRVQPMFAGWGAIRSVTFLRIDLREAHVYRVEFASSPPVTFTITLEPDGTIRGLGFRPAPPPRS
jgi:CubicO group peptidase (beta-lactamase class C family)